MAEDSVGLVATAEDARLIGRTLALYCQLLDDLRFADFGELFTEDAEWVIPGVTFQGRAAIVEGLTEMEPKASGWVKHLSFPPVIEIDGPAAARAWSDLVALVRDHDTGAWSIAASGRYYDRLEKSGGKWRFKSRRADIDTGQNPLSGLIRPPAL